MERGHSSQQLDDWESRGKPAGREPRQETDEETDFQTTATGIDAAAFVTHSPEGERGDQQRFIREAGNSKTPCISEALGIPDVSMRSNRRRDTPGCRSHQEEQRRVEDSRLREDRNTECHDQEEDEDDDHLLPFSPSFVATPVLQTGCETVKPNSDSRSESLSSLVLSASGLGEGGRTRVEEIHEYHDSSQALSNERASVPGRKEAVTILDKHSFSQREMTDEFPRRMVFGNDGSDVQASFPTKDVGSHGEHRFLRNVREEPTGDKTGFGKADDSSGYNPKHDVIREGGVFSPSPPSGKTRLDSGGTSARSDSQEGDQQEHRRENLQTDDEEEDWVGALSEGLPSVAEDFSEAQSPRSRKASDDIKQAWLPCHSSDSVWAPNEFLVSGGAPQKVGIASRHERDHPCWEAAEVYVPQVTLNRLSPFQPKTRRGSAHTSHSTATASTETWGWTLKSRRQPVLLHPTLERLGDELSGATTEVAVMPSPLTVYYYDESCPRQGHLEALAAEETVQRLECSRVAGIQFLASAGSCLFSSCAQDEDALPSGIPRHYSPAVSEGPKEINNRKTHQFGSTAQASLHHCLRKQTGMIHKTSVDGAFSPNRLRQEVGAGASVAATGAASLHGGAKREPAYYLLYGSSEDSNSRPQSADSLFLASAASRAFSPLPSHQHQVEEARGMSPAGTPPSARSVVVTGGSTSSSRMSESGGSPALCHPGEVLGDASLSGQDLPTDSCVLRSALQCPSPSDGTRRAVQNVDSSPCRKDEVASAALFSPSNSSPRAPPSSSPEHLTRFLRSPEAQGFSASPLSSLSKPLSIETTPKRASHTTDNGMKPRLRAKQEIDVSSRSPLSKEGVWCTTGQSSVIFSHGSGTESKAAATVAGRPSDVSMKLQERIQETMQVNCVPEESGEWQKKMQAHLCVHFCRQGLLARVLYMSERPSPHPLFSWRRPPGMYSTAGW
ncbi:hypothetical protein CSUI_000785 [Cystoisospora suis]|uniref:Uncharacterized protein n=1 Tax=Cystoisospora suis TaxID=483139 RepID=A0A2C6LEU8_9APIC|nr:hypothetical protein CSUI_000785 [Cystoisospora suis]